MTGPQLEVMRAMVRSSRAALADGRRPDIATRELSRRTGRYGQVVGHSCGRLADAGLLQRRGRALYRLTAAGIAAWREAELERLEAQRALERELGRLDETSLERELEDEETTARARARARNGRADQ